ncbi:hypothetical protein ACYOEI_41335, partial [Singulisphaera rosea]
RVTDEYGAVDIASAKLTVLNVAPTVTSLVSDHGDPEANPSVDGIVRITGTVSDPGKDTQVVRVNWGDGSALQTFAVDPVTKTFNATHTYAAGGIYNVTVDAVDSDSAVSQTVTTKAVVSGIVLVDGVLYVYGSKGPDDITVSAKNGKFVTVEATLNATGGAVGRKVQQTFRRADIARIVVVAFEGNDKVHLDTSSRPGVRARGGARNRNLAIPTVVFGGPGNDILSSVGGNSILVGGDGDDWLKGRNGRNLLIGGLGRDKLIGGRGQDLLI